MIDGRPEVGDVVHFFHNADTSNKPEMGHVIEINGQGEKNPLGNGTIKLFTIDRLGGTHIRRCARHVSDPHLTENVEFRSMNGGWDWKESDKKAAADQAKMAKVRESRGSKKDERELVEA